MIGYSPFRLQAAQDSTGQHLSVDNSCLEGTKDCRDPYGEALQLLAAVADGLPKSCVSKEGDLEEKSDSLVTLCSGINDKPRSHIMASPSQQSEVRTNGGVVALARAASIKSTPNDIARPQMAKVDDKQEWGIHGIIGKEEIDGVVHYWVDWNPTLVPKYDLGNARVLVEKFEARLQKQGKQKRGKQRKTSSSAGNPALVEVHAVSGKQ
jgi:hypothetical protein